MKTVVSISLGSPTRNKAADQTYAGVDFHLERIGTDGNVERAGDLIAEWDGKADAIGLGGMDRYLVAGTRFYEIKQVGKLARRAKTSAIVDGGGVKRTIEPRVIRQLAQQGKLEVAGKRVLVMAGVDRPGMAAVFPELGAARVVYGDIPFALKLPVPMTSLRQVRFAAALFLPLFCRLPMSMLYVTGEKQKVNTPRFPRYFAEADIIAGDFAYINRYMPARLDGKVIVTNTTREKDRDEWRQRGVKKLVTTTPDMGSASFGTNVLEGVLVTLAGKRPEQMTEEDYLTWADRIGWEPGVVEFGAQ